jgi:hypothetical protein
VDTTLIAGRPIPVQPGPRTKVHFSANCNPADPPGAYDFWALLVENGGMTGRWPAGGDPGDRFRQMEGLPGYEEHWQAARTAVLIRPASGAEVIKWMHAHPTDAPCAGHCVVGNKEFQIARQQTGEYALVQPPIAKGT